KVIGLKRRSSNLTTGRIDHLLNNPNLELVYGDLTDSSSITSFIADHKPDFCYHLAAMSHVRVSYEIPESTMEMNCVGTIRLLEAIRKYSPETRFLHSGTSEMFGGLGNVAQNESTPFYPKSPYGVSKLGAYFATINYRESYGLFACNSLSFNHESYR